MKGLTLLLLATLTLAKPAARKLVFSPYVNLDADLSANELGKEGVAPTSTPMMGPFGHSPVPAYGLGGMMPQSLGLTSQPMNMMYGQQMMHPAAAMAQAGQGRGGANQQAQSNAMNDFDELDDIKINDKFDSVNKLSLFDDPLNPSDASAYACPNIQSQAIDISNAIMKERNKEIFKEIMKYLLKSKYLIATTEIKMVSALKQKIYGLMKTYSNVTQEQVDAVMNADGKVLDMDKDIEEKYGDAERTFDLKLQSGDFEDM